MIYEPASRIFEQILFPILLHFTREIIRNINLLTQSLKSIPQTISHEILAVYTKIKFVFK